MRTAGTWGTVVKLRNGKYSPRYTHLHHKFTGPPQDTEKIARGYLAAVKHSIDTGTWLPPDKADPIRPDLPKATPTFSEFAEGWIVRRETGVLRDRKGNSLRPKTAVEYRKYLALLPDTITSAPLDTITSATIREWYEGRPATPTMNSRMYAFVKQVFELAMPAAMGDDAYIQTNPCRVRGAGGRIEPATKLVSDPRPKQVEQIMEAMPDRLKAAVAIGAYCAMRIGEVTTLQRGDVNLRQKVVHVKRSGREVKGGVELGDPKTAAGRRLVPIPDIIVPILESHLENYVAKGKDSWLFPASRNPGPISYSSFEYHWNRTVKKLGVTFRIHWLRHAGLTWIGQADATTADLQSIAGHATPDAAMRYQHSSHKRAQDLAKKVSKMAKKER